MGAIVTPQERKRIARRRSRVRALRDEGLSIRQIAERLGCGRTTVSDDLKAETLDGPPPPPKDNQRAVKHGAYSDRATAALRAHYEHVARERWPWLEEYRVTTWARLAARVDHLARFEGENGVLRPDGRVFDATDRGVKFERQLEKMTAEFDASAPPSRTSGTGDDAWVSERAAEASPLAREAMSALAGRSITEILSDPGLAAKAAQVLEEIRGSRGEAAPAPESEPSPSAAAPERAPAVKQIAPRPPLRPLLPAPAWPDDPDHGD